MEFQQVAEAISAVRHFAATHTHPDATDQDALFLIEITSEDWAKTQKISLGAALEKIVGRISAHGPGFIVLPGLDPFYDVIANGGGILTPVRNKNKAPVLPVYRP